MWNVSYKIVFCCILILISQSKSFAFPAQVDCVQCVGQSVAPLPISSQSEALLQALINKPLVNVGFTNPGVNLPTLAEVQNQQQNTTEKTTIFPDSPEQFNPSAFKFSSNFIQLEQ